MKITNPVAQIPGILNFFKEVKVETTRVNWPTREKTIKDTVIVIVFAVVIAIFLSVFDYAFQFLLNEFVI
ncbi:MAG TPA: preprotein translocase subunit SecE [Candidatus Paceibacterota bacterium]|nr:preprotein translocase subunit SecE [Candidatus Paceibacterota bacterium]